MAASFLIGSMLSGLRPNFITLGNTDRLTISEASVMFERAKGALYADCRYLGIDTSVPRGGCLDKDDCWILYVFLCWKLHGQQTKAWWRGDRADYEQDCQTAEQKLAYVQLVGGSKLDFNRRFDTALDRKRINALPEICYG